MNVAVDILPGLNSGGGRWQQETVKVLGVEVGRKLSGLTAFSFGKRFPMPKWIPHKVNYKKCFFPGKMQWLLSNVAGISVETLFGLKNIESILVMNLHPLKAKCPVVLGVADVSWRSYSGQYRTTFNSTQIRLAECAIEQADHILTISASSASELVRDGIPANRITVALLGVGEEFRSAPSEISRVRTLYGLPEQFVLHVGGINERKNIGVLVAALELLGGTIPLIMAGPIPYEPLTYWGLDVPWIKHLGYIPDSDIPGLFASATVKVFPSKLEGYGLPIVEAMAAGTPVIAADTPVFREVAGDAAVFFLPDDAPALARSISMAFECSEFRLEYIARGKNLAAIRTWAAYGDGVFNALMAARK
jgi:glycosyltransferase involved in cell wall biosynthesis